jgi:hypothetical protein
MGTILPASGHPDRLSADGPKVDGWPLTGGTRAASPQVHPTVTTSLTGSVAVGPAS